jgi:hypothetical protein
VIRCIAVFFLTMCALNSMSFAEDQWYADIAFANGGDDLAEVEVEYYDGDTDNVDITAGGGVSFAFGRRFDLGADAGWQVLTTLGYKSDGVFGDDGDSAEFDRFVVDAIAVHQWQRAQLGAGLTYEFNVELDLDDVNGGSQDFDNSLGYVIQVDWRATQALNIGLRYTVIEYELSDFDGLEADGDNVSLRAGFSF